MASESNGNERSHKTLSMRLTPFKNKRPIFDTSRFISSPKTTSKRSRLNMVAEQGQNGETTTPQPTTPKPIHLWSSPIAEKSSTQSSLNRRAKRLELSTLDANTTTTTTQEETKNGWISQTGKFHSWTESFSQFDRRNRTKKQEPTTKPKKEQQWGPLGRYEMTKHERELLAELKKTTKTATYSAGWKHMTFDEFKKSAPPRRERGQNDPRPYGWRGARKATSTATASVQTETASTATTVTTTETVTKETVTTTTQESLKGGGKVRAKKNRAHESRKKDNDEDEVIRPSYSLDNIQPILTTTTAAAATPVIKLAKSESDEFSQPRAKSSSSQPKQVNETSAFSFSQPKGLNKLNLDTPPPSQPPPPEPKPLMSSGFGDLIKKQKAANWSCDICMTSNALDADKCLACEEPNPKAPKKEDKKEPPKFSFGVSADPPPNVTAPTTTEPPKFSFGAKKEEEKKEPTPPPLTNGFGAFMEQAKKDTWDCSICMISNKKDAAKCVACEEPNPNAAPKTDEKKNEPPKFAFGVAAAPPTTMTPAAAAAPIASGFGDLIKQQKQANWSCDICMTSNKLDAVKCLACEEPNPNAPKTEEKKEPPKFSFGAPSAPPPLAAASSGFGDLINKQKEANWSCGICMTNNKLDAAKCLACEEPNPNAPKTEDTKDEKKETPKFSFGVAAPTPTSTAAPNTTGFGQPVKTGSDQPAKTFSFGAPQTTKSDGEKPSFSFGATPSTTSESTKAAPPPTFSFGAKKEAETPKEQAPPTFGFGAAAGVKTEEKAEPKAPSFSFGAATTKPASEPAKPSFSFAPTPAAVAPAPAATAAPTFSFQKTAEPKQETPAFSFGGGGKKRPNPGAAAPVEPAKFSFGGGASALPKPAEAPKPSFSFGAAKAETPAAPSGLFGAPAATTTAPSAPSFSFGGAGAAAKPAETTTTKPAFSFNAAPAAAPAASAAAPSNSMFSPQMEPSKSAFSFGGASNGATAAPPAVAPPVQNSNQNNSGFNFGATTTANKPSMFQPSAPTGSMFGENKSSAPSFSFGGASSSNSKEPFTFGAAQPQQQQQQQPSGMFGSSQPAGGSMFGASAEQPKPVFGQSSTQPPSFSFGASSQPAAPAPFGQASSQPANAFAPQQSNMFQASQGATQSQGTPGGQGRRIAKARRRNQRK